MSVRVTTKTLEEWRQTIDREVPFVDRKPYSHNIISVALMAIAKTYGDYEANKAIDDFKLERLGWQKKEQGGSK